MMNTRAGPNQRDGVRCWIGQIQCPITKQVSANIISNLLTFKPDVYNGRFPFYVHRTGC